MKIGQQKFKESDKDDGQSVNKLFFCKVERQMQLVSSLKLCNAIINASDVWNIDASSLFKWTFRGRGSKVKKS